MLSGLYSGGLKLKIQMMGKKVPICSGWVGVDACEEQGERYQT